MNIALICRRPLLHNRDVGLRRRSVSVRSTLRTVLSDQLHRDHSAVINAFDGPPSQAR